MTHASYSPSRTPGSTRTNGLATSGFVVALIGFILSLIPFVGTVSWLLSPVGLILSAVGLAQASRRGAGKGLGIAGVVLGLLGLLFCIIYTVSFANAVSDAPALGAPPSSAPSAPSSAPSAGAPAPAGTFSAGTYQVGQEITPGRYKTTGGSFCSWSRNKSDDGQLESIIANGIVQGQGSVSVKSTDAFVEFGGDCTWTKQP